MQIRANPIIPVADARQLLGEEATQMSDEEVQQLIDDFDILAQYAIKMVLKEHTNDHNEMIK